MKIIEQKYEILDYNPLEPLKHIEKIGRVCYKSEDKITEDGESARKFVKMLVDHGHCAMIEHASLAFEFKTPIYNALVVAAGRFSLGTGQHCQLRSSIFNGHFVISGNLRAWKELLDYDFSLPEGPWHSKEVRLITSLPKEMLDVFRSIPEVFSGEEYDRLQTSDESCTLITDDVFRARAKEYNDTREIDLHCNVSVKFTTDRGISHEIVRHRPASFAQESTRYVNYSKDKFGNEIQVIDPFTAIQYDSKMNALDKDLIEAMHRNWKEAMESAEEKYMSLITAGASPQMARSILPNSTKTEIVMTANIAEWKHFFELRTAPAAHPQMRELVIPLEKELNELWSIGEKPEN